MIVGEYEQWAVFNIVAMVLKMFLKIPVWFIGLISKCNSGFYGRDESYFVCTHLTSAGNQAYSPGTGDTVMTLFHCSLICLNIFNIMHCCRRLTCSREHPLLVIFQQAQNICMTFLQRRPNVFDVGPTLYKFYTIVLCLLGSFISKHDDWFMYSL